MRRPAIPVVRAVVLVCILAGRFRRRLGRAEQLESREAEIFFIIPSLLILKTLEGDDKDICSFFNPDMFDKKSSQGQQLQALK